MNCIKSVVLVVALFVWTKSASSENLSVLEEVNDRIGRNDTSFYSYRPSYFGWTMNHSDEENEGGVKFQLSLKYEIAEDSGWFFGYTQKSYWDIHKTSAPFRENNFAPEFFKLYNLRGGKEEGTVIDMLKNIDNLESLQIGFWRHESTGEDGVGSHGWNTTYIEPTFVIGNFSITPRVWIPALFQSKATTAPDNEDIFDYYGYGDLRVTYASKKDNQHSILLRKGNNSDRYAVMYQWDKRFGDRETGVFNPKIFLQIWSGYGESLKNYDRYTNSVVIGISAIR